MLPVHALLYYIQSAPTVRYAAYHSVMDYVCKSICLDYVSSPHISPINSSSLSLDEIINDHCHTMQALRELLETATKTKPRCVCRAVHGRHSRTIAEPSYLNSHTLHARPYLSAIVDHRECLLLIRVALLTLLPANACYTYRRKHVRTMP